MKKSSMNNLAEFFRLITTLKSMERKPPPGVRLGRRESTAEHCFLATWLAWILASKKKNLDVGKIIKMALVHDLAKVVLDGKEERLFSGARKRTSELVIKWPKLSLAEKNKIMLERTIREQKKVQKIAGLLEPALKDEVLSLWQDAEWGKSPEARFGWQVAVLENLIQAFIYYRDNPRVSIEPWILHAKKFVDDPILLDFLAAVEEMIKQAKRKRSRKR